MAIHVFKFVGSSEAVSPDFGRMMPGQDIKMVTERNKVKMNKDDRVYFVSEMRLLFLGASPEWEPVSKSAKDISILVDPDHLRCDLENGSREHFVLFHPDAVKDWDMMHKEKEESKEGE